ncbi:MAG: hypothetical protein AB2L14_10635 [Candidatus Xenobiia bacterium LiM19]
MIYVLSGIFIVLLILSLSFSGCGKTAGPSSPGSLRPGAAVASPQTKPATQNLSREEIAAKLKKLSESPPPKDLKMGAECYKVAMPPDRAEYLCPVCGQRTLYASEKKGRSADAGFIEEDLPECRRLIKEIKGLDVSLNESEYCRKCSPDAKNPALILVVKYQGLGTPYRYRNIRSEDLILIREFMEGKDRHRDSYDFETPMKDHLKRLNELLGVQ